jgi:hypothetical protein
MWEICSFVISSWFLSMSFTRDMASGTKETKLMPAPEPDTAPLIRNGTWEIVL